MTVHRCAAVLAITLTVVLGACSSSQPVATAKSPSPNHTAPAATVETQPLTTQVAKNGPGDIIVPDMVDQDLHSPKTPCRLLVSTR